MTEFRYKFQWEDKKLVNDISHQVYTRIDFCSTTQNEHRIFYLTKADRSELKKYIERTSYYFGYKTAAGNVQNYQIPSVSNASDNEESHSSGHQNVGDDEFQVVTRNKGKKKK